ncbi:MAG: putative enzyme related to lactoylglutathione lyase [Paracoccaceae bacterium]|jgi:predicted enzyme related to lactoylglutathione lyase
MAFYAATTDMALRLDENDPFPMAVFGGQNGGTSGHLYVVTPAAPGTGPTIHLAVEGALERAMERCAKAGGTIISPIVAIPPGRFVRARDIDGNSIGPFETA